MELLFVFACMGVVAVGAVTVMDKTTGIISGPIHIARRLYGPLKWLMGSEEKPKGARFMSDDEVRAHFRPNNQGLLIDGKHKRLSAIESYNNVMIVAQIGAGKTRRYVMPNILTLDNCSFVITDPAGELHQQTAGDLTKRGYKICVLNPSDPLHSHRYNPLKRAQTFTQYQEVASILVDASTGPVSGDGAFWNNGAKELIELFIACLHAYGKKNRYTYHLPNVYQLLQRMFDADAMDAFIAENAPDEIYVDRYASLIAGQNAKTVQGYLSTALNAMKNFGNPDLAQLFIGDDFQFSRMRKEKTAIFVVVPSERIATYSYVLNLFYYQLFSSLTSSTQSIGGNDLPIYALLDEFGHYKLNNFETFVNTMRKFNISVSIILQSIHQLHKQYGEHAAKSIVGGGIGTRIFYSGIDLETAKTVEAMMGKVVISQKSSNGQTYVREENLMNADRLIRMQANQAVLLMRNQEPLIMETELVHNQRKFAQRMRIPAPPYPEKKCIKIKRVAFQPSATSSPKPHKRRP